jgi:hypothetical protein
MTTTRITIEYDGGLDTELDAKLRDLAETFGGTDRGSGCFLDEPYTRDIEFEVPSQSADDFQTQAEWVVRTHQNPELLPT